MKLVLTYLHLDSPRELWFKEACYLMNSLFSFVELEFKDMLMPWFVIFKSSLIGCRLKLFLVALSLIEYIFRLECSLNRVSRLTVSYLTLLMEGIFSRLVLWFCWITMNSSRGLKEEESMMKREPWLVADILGVRSTNSSRGT